MDSLVSMNESESVIHTNNQMKGTHILLLLRLEMAIDQTGSYVILESSCP